MRSIEIEDLTPQDHHYLGVFQLSKVPCFLYISFQSYEYE